MTDSAHSVPSFMKQECTHSGAHIANKIQISIPSLKDKYVAMIPNAFSKEECKEWIQFSEQIGYKDALVNLGFGYQQNINEFRNHKKFSIDNTNMARYIFDRLQTAIPPTFNNRKVVDINERLRFLRYAPNQYFGAHYDGMFMRDNGQRSLITIIIYLNDNYDGGELTFLHPTDQHKTHSIQPHTGMVLLFEQSELFHEGSIVLQPQNGSTPNQNVYKYCVRSDIMYSKQRIEPHINNNNAVQKYSSYEVEKQKVYFQRNKAIKSMSLRPHGQYSDGYQSKDSITTKIVHFWLIESFPNNLNKQLFPAELYEEVAKYCRIIGVLDFICDANELETLARIAETAERYSEMVELMATLVELKSRSFYNKHKANDMQCSDETCSILTTEQRNLFSVAFKNVVGEKRASWRTLNGGFEDNEVPIYVMAGYKRIIERELKDMCLEVIYIIKTHLIDTLEACAVEHTSLEAIEGIVFYHKMAGDYYRYLAEFVTDSPEYKEKAGVYYTKAMEHAKGKLLETHPTRLGLSLNYAVYLYEIAKEPEKACNIAKAAFDGAIEKLNTLNDASYKDSTLIMRLLRDNLTLWSSEGTGDSDDDDAS